MVNSGHSLRFVRCLDQGEWSLGAFLHVAYSSDDGIGSNVTDVSDIFTSAVHRYAIASTGKNLSTHIHPHPNCANC